MATWAQIVGGIARDVCGGDDNGPHVAGGYDPHGVGWTRVPDGTQSGATDNGNGTFTNPASPAAVPRILSKTGFQDLAWANLAGGGTQGMARFNAIMKACASGSDLLQACFDRYDAADTFAKDKVATLTALMVAGAVMTSDERAAVLNNWPTS